MSITDGWDPPRPGWTCRECGFDYDGTEPTSAADAVRTAGERYRRPLTRGLRDEDLDGVLRSRPDDRTIGRVLRHVRGR